MHAGRLSSIILVLVVTAMATAVRLFTFWAFELEYAPGWTRLWAFAGVVAGVSAAVLIPMGLMLDCTIATLRKHIESAAAGDAAVSGPTTKWLRPVTRALIGAVVCSHRGTHLTAGVLPLLVRDPMHRRQLGRFNDLVLLALFCVLGKAGWDLSLLTMGQTTTALQMPAGILYLAVPVCCAALALVHLGLLLHPGIRE